MYRNIKVCIICVIFLQVLCVSSDRIKPEIEEYHDDVMDKISINDETPGRQFNSTVYKTVNKYYCSLNTVIEGSHLMVYGTKGWTFPVQDVNLTLRYPMSENVGKETFDSTAQNDMTVNVTDEAEYLITGFKVILYIDGPGSEGFISNGGVLQETITLSFISSSITTLHYHFWVYGVRKDTSESIEPTAHYLC